MKPRLLFITPKIDERHDDLAFASLWARAFADAGFDVTVICGEKGETSLPFPIHSLSHEPGQSRLRTFLRFQRLIMTLRYDRVFVHLGQRWLGAGAWWWRLTRKPTYLWYTHYTYPLSLKIGARMVKRMFCATKDSLPQFEGDPRKVVTGHGIDTRFWNVEPVSEESREPVTHLLSVHRIARSKRLDILLRALAFLPPDYTLTHYGRRLDVTNADDAAYDRELKDIVATHHLESRVRFMGSVPMPELRRIYPRYRVIANMVPRTIDKTVLEAMFCGCTPVIARDHADAIGYAEAPRDASPEAVADFIRSLRLKTREELRRLVEERHGLKRLIEKMAEYIRPGN